MAKKKKTAADLLPDYVLEACANARALAHLCGNLGLGQPELTEIPGLLEQLHHDHAEEPFFWEKGFEEHEP